MNYPQLWKFQELCLCILFTSLAVPQAEAGSHRVRGGETFTSIARQHGISINRLAALNPSVKPHFILKGQNLVIPDSSGRKITARTSARTRGSSADSRGFSRSSGASLLGGSKPEARKSSAKPRSTEAIASYKVKKGDTLTQIANRNGLTVKQLMTMNRLSGSRLSIGQSLIVPASGSRDEHTVDLSPPSPRARSGSSTAPSRSSRKKEPEPEPKPKSRESSIPPPGTYYHIVRKNQDFSSIAAEHGVTWGQLARANRRVSPDSLRVNQRLIIPASLTTSSSRAPVREPAPRPAASRERQSPPPTRSSTREKSSSLLADSMKAASRTPSRGGNHDDQQPSASRLADTGADAAPARQPAGEPEDPLSPAVEPEDAASAPTPMTAYKVAEGETIDTIAKEFATTPAELRRMNNMNSFDNPIPDGYVFVPWSAPLSQE